MAHDWGLSLIAGGGSQIKLHQAADARRSLAEQAIVPGENRFKNAPFPGDNQSQKLLDAAHCVDGGIVSSMGAVDRRSTKCAPALGLSASLFNLFSRTLVDDFNDVPISERCQSATLC